MFHAKHTKKIIKRRNSNLTRGTGSTAMKKDMEKKFVRYRRALRLKQHLKDARAKCARYLRSKCSITPKSKKFAWDRIIKLISRNHSV